MDGLKGEPMRYTKATDVHSLKKNIITKLSSSWQISDNRCTCKNPIVIIGKDVDGVDIMIEDDEDFSTSLRKTTSMDVILKVHLECACWSNIHTCKKQKTAVDAAAISMADLTVKFNRLKPTIVNPHRTTSSKDEVVDLMIDGTDKEDFVGRIVWVYPRRGGTSRTKWRQLKKIEDRSTVQTCLYDTPEKIVKQRTNPMIRMTNLDPLASSIVIKVTDEGGKNVSDFVKGKSETLFLGASAAVCKKRHEAEFPNFMINESSFDEQRKRYMPWYLNFHCFDESGREMYKPMVVGPILIVSNVSQIDASKFFISKVDPDTVIAGKKTTITLTGRFETLVGKKDPETVAVIAGDQKQSYTLTDDAIVFNYFKAKPATVNVFVRDGKHRCKSFEIHVVSEQRKT